MNVLIVGGGKGSFTMRGLQLGAAIGARVMTEPTAADWAWADGVVLIKRAGAQWAAKAHEAQLPIVWDALDFWSQPRDNRLSEADARARLRQEVGRIRPDVIIGATAAMAEACGGIYLPHHSWSGLTPTPARETVNVVAYEGNPAYLGAWRSALDQACERRGWRFVVNPFDLRAVDLLVAVRDGEWDGWMCREWKSGVKVVNAIAAGRPLIGQASAAIRELQPPGSEIESAADIGAAFDAWTDLEARQRAVDACRALAPAVSLEAVADRYRAILSTLPIEVSA